MTVSKKYEEDFIQYHKDGSIWAKGKMVEDTRVGYCDRQFR